MPSNKDYLDPILPNQATNNNNNMNPFHSSAPSSTTTSPWVIGATTVSTTTGASSAPVVESTRPRSASPHVPSSVATAAPFVEIRQAATPSPPPPSGGAAIGPNGQATTTTTLQSLTNQNHPPPQTFQHSSAVEAILAASCQTMGFDIAEMWLRTGPKTHQLINSHLRPTSLEESVRNDIFNVYYGQESSERTHRLSPALCKRAKEAMDVVWVTAHSPMGAQALKLSLSNVRTAVAVPVCHAPTQTNMTIIFFSIKRISMMPTAVEFLVHMSLSAAIASVNAFQEAATLTTADENGSTTTVSTSNTSQQQQLTENHIDHHHNTSQSEHIPSSNNIKNNSMTSFKQVPYHFHPSTSTIVNNNGVQLDLQWRQLRQVEYLTDGGNSWIHTAILNGRPVVVKTLKPECQDVVLAINEIEGELAVLSRLCHDNIVELMGAGTTSKGVRFVVLERLDGGTLTQMLGYDTRIRDRRRRFWRKKNFPFVNVLTWARDICRAMAYLQDGAIQNGMVLHRDLKPDNIGFTLNKQVKILDFGLSRIIENASAQSNEIYEMSGETGSLRYMAPEVADSLPYNHKADVYSFGMILWELNALKKPFDGLDRDEFFERVVHGGERPPINKKWPSELSSLMQDCWNPDSDKRPNFDVCLERIEEILQREKHRSATPLRKTRRALTTMIDRHSTWF